MRLSCRPRTISLWVLLASIIWTCVPGATVHAQAGDGTPAVGTVTGRVVAKSTGEPLAAAVVSIVGTEAGTWVDEGGRFRIEGLQPGEHMLAISRIGFEAARVPVVIEVGGVADIEIALVEEAIKLSAVRVTPSRFAIMGDEPHGRQALTEEEIQSMPQLGADIYRAVARLPGISANDYSAKFTVRGGEHEEVLVLLDGLELYDAFHLKDISGGALSIVDAEAIEGIDLLTGGFPAEHGDRTSGVFSIDSRRPQPGQTRHSIGISMMNTRLMSEGTFDKGSWLVSARRGYLDVVLWLMNEAEDLSPKYYDALAKVEYELSPDHTLSAHLLHADDSLALLEDDDDDTETGYGNSYGWLSLKSALGARLSARTILALGRVAHDRTGIGFLDDGVRPDFNVNDERRFTSAGLKQDWRLDATERHYLKWGVDLKRVRATYDYLSADTWYEWPAPGKLEVGGIDSTAFALRPTATRVGLYAADRFRVVSPLAVEAGLRYDAASYADDRLLSPRVNFVYAVDRRTSVRGGWGLYHQSQGIHEIRVQEDEASFLPAEQAAHWVLGLEHYLGDRVTLRLEGYRKRIEDRRPSYRSWLNDIEMFPEMLPDRVRVDVDRTTSRGIEIYLKSERARRLTWWASYALAKVDDRVQSITAGTETIPIGRALPGVYDQRHTLYLDLNYRPSPRWHLGLAWQYRSGWPFTEQVLREGTWEDGATYLYSTAGEPHGARYPAFHRADLRLSRHFEAAGGRLSTFLEIVNLYNRGNVRRYNYIWRRGPAGELRLNRQPEHWFKLLPSIGVSWSWGS